jgi:hypothetical protein
VPVPSLSKSAPVAVLLSGCALLGAGIAGVARVDAPLQAAVERQSVPPAHHDVDVRWDHRDRHHGRDCPPRRT